MIFYLHFFLILAGYSACGLLLGSYMIKYSGASDLDLGFVFMIQPLTVFFRPIICARADRFQSHKRLLCQCLFGIAVAYIPFIVLPFLIEHNILTELLTNRVKFWILVSSHLIGSLFFCGIRSLGDALAVNYAKRIGSDFTTYRKYGSIGFGTCGYLLGHINQNWLLPDFIPSFLMYVGSMSTLLVLVYLWPDEHFVIVSDQHRKQVGHDNGKHHSKEIPNSREILTHMRDKLCRTVFCCYGSDKRKEEVVKSHHRATASTIVDDETGSTSVEVPNSSLNKTEQHYLSMKQQAKIFLLLLRRDIRIPLFMLLLLYGGMVGYAPQNFVFTYMYQVCTDQGICNAASLAGLVMISYCAVETICYLVFNAIRSNINHLILIEITLVSLALHYYFYGFILNQVSPYFFLVECLHGLEYSASLVTGVELGYKFANEVELILPELIARGIISKNDNQELVKLSLMATMNACFTMIYDGAGSILGAFVYGIVAENYSFDVVWILIGSLATAGFVFVLIVVLVGKLFHVQPQIHKIQQQQQQGTKNYNISGISVKG